MTCETTLLKCTVDLDRLIADVERKAIAAFTGATLAFAWLIWGFHLEIPFVAGFWFAAFLFEIRDTAKSVRTLTAWITKASAAPTLEAA
jgi:hypothetical protein